MPSKKIKSESLLSRQPQSSHIDENKGNGLIRDARLAVERPSRELTVASHARFGHRGRVPSKTVGDCDHDVASYTHDTRNGRLGGVSYRLKNEIARI